MALGLKQDWTLPKLSEDIAIPSAAPSVRYVGGSPGKNNNGYASGATSEAEVDFVMVNDWATESNHSHATVILPTAYIDIEVDSDEQEDNDNATPFDTSRTYSVGDCLRAKTKTFGSNTYAVWTNEDYTNTPSGAGDFIVFPAKVHKVTGTTGLTIFFGAVFKQAS